VWRDRLKLPLHKTWKHVGEWRYRFTHSSPGITETLRISFINYPLSPGDQRIRRHSGSQSRPIQNFCKGQQVHLNVILLFSNHRHVSKHHGAIFKLVETYRWLLCNKITFINSSAFVCLFKNFASD
jgi:hypothetical protein